jgi:hypothetical protein
MSLEGVIEKVVDDVAWGTMDDGSTFDIPSYGHVVGDKVVRNLRPADAAEDDDGDMSYILMGAKVATVIVVEFGDDGMEIVAAEQFYKHQN